MCWKSKRNEKLFVLFVMAIIIFAGGYYVLYQKSSESAISGSVTNSNTSTLGQNNLFTQCNFTLLTSNTLCVYKGVLKAEVFSFSMPQGVKGIYFLTYYNNTSLNECFGPAAAPDTYSPCLPDETGNLAKGGIFLTTVSGLWYFGYYEVTITAKIHVVVYDSLTFTGKNIEN